MKMSSKFVCHLVLASFVIGVFTSNTALAETPRQPFSKALTFTLSTPTPATPDTSRPHYLPGVTKYTSVKLTRARSQVAMESLELAHEGFLEANTPAQPRANTGDGKYVVRQMIGRPKAHVNPPAGRRAK